VSEEPPYVFICFSSSDAAVAREVVQRLEAAGLHCWISLRDVPPGHNYQESIILALEAAKGVVFLYSESSSASGETKKELSVAGSLNMPVIPLRLSPITPTGAWRYELATRQWIDIFPDREPGIQRLIDAVRKVLHPGDAGQRQRAEIGPTARGPGLDESPTAGLTAQSLPAAAARVPVLAPGSQEFEAIRVMLARHIGPIAKIYLQKAVTEVETTQDLCDRLAVHIATGSDRAAFLREASSRLAKKPG
jgi:hypothetical protein